MLATLELWSRHRRKVRGECNYEMAHTLALIEGDYNGPLPTEPTDGLHLDRTPRRHRHHRGPGGYAFAGVGQSQRQGAVHHVHEQSQTTPARLAPVHARQQ